jgi:hypothetical protein
MVSPFLICLGFNEVLAQDRLFYFTAGIIIHGPLRLFHSIGWCDLVFSGAAWWVWSVGEGVALKKFGRVGSNSYVCSRTISLALFFRLQY